MTAWQDDESLMMTRQKDMIWTRTENQGGEGSCGWCSVDWRWTQLSWTARSGRRLTPWALQYFSYNRGRQYFQQFFNCVSIQQECHANHNYHSPGSSRLRNWDVSELFVIYILYFMRIRWCVLKWSCVTTITTIIVITIMMMNTGQILTHTEKGRFPGEQISFSLSHHRQRLVHLEINIGSWISIAIASFSSQEPGFPIWAPQMISHYSLAPINSFWCTLVKNP